LDASQFDNGVVATAHDGRGIRQLDLVCLRPNKPEYLKGILVIATPSPAVVLALGVTIPSASLEAVDWRIRSRAGYALDSPSNAFTEIQLP
jgi:hypothetical protein